MRKENRHSTPFPPGHLLRRPVWIALAVLMLGTLVSVAGGFYLEQWQSQWKQTRFDELAQQAIVDGRTRMRTYQHGLRAARGAILAAGVDSISL